MSCTGVWDAAAQDLHSGVLGTIGVNPAISGTGSINAPDNVGWGICLSLKYGEVKNLLLMDHQGVWIQRNDGISWSKWKRFSTATPPQEYDLPLAQGVVGTAKYFKTQEDIIHITLSAVEKSQWNSGDLISNLPEGFRPASDLWYCAAVGDGTSVIGTCDIKIQSNGAIIVAGYAVGNNGGKRDISSIALFIAAKE